MCPVIKELKKSPLLQTVVCSTGQHKEMLQQVLDVFGVKPEFDLNVMEPNQTLSELTARILDKIQWILEEEEPELVLVHGDTTTAYATALACFYKKIAVGHIEAGLRTNNTYSPYPEEFNRKSIDMIAKLLFAPTKEAKDNLIKENRNEEEIFVTGNTVIDAILTTVQADYEHEYLAWAKGSRLLLLTTHRRENYGSAMENIFKAVNRIVDENRDVKIIFPVHRSPRVRETAERFLIKNDRVLMVEPLGAIDFHNIMANSYLILTDSGGIQEEASALGKPVLVMRDTTERPEGVEAGILELVGVEEQSIYERCKALLSNAEQYQKMTEGANPYGDGKASERILQVILRFMGEKG